MTGSERLELLCAIIEAFEEFLDEKGIVIENEEKKQSPDPSNIYGEDYFILESRIGNILEDWDLIPPETECF